jgi:hypothetical protein
VTVPAERPVADGEHGAVDAVQPPLLHAARDRAVRQANLAQLCARHHAVLATASRR